MNPKISIITITYNSEKTLEETIKSVVSQNYDNFEYLIIDGGSTDKTLDIVNRYREHISFVLSESDRGISDAFNKGVKNATGEIVGIINSDDLLLPNALSNIAKAYESDVDVYRGNTIAWDDVNGTKIKDVPRMEFRVNSLITGNVCHQSTFVSKAAYLNYGLFREELRYMMDVDLLIRLYEGGAKFKYINKDLAVSRMGGVTDQHPFWKKKNEVYDIVITNGGNIVIALMKTAKFVLYQCIKKIMFYFGADNMRKIKYRKKIVK